MSRAADDKRCGHGCSHDALLPSIAPIQSEVCMVGPFGQKFREAALVLRVIQHCWYYSITDGFDRLATGLLPIFVASHAIGHDKQAKWVRAGMIGARPMYSQDIILVRIIFAPDARVRGTADLQAYGTFLIWSLHNGQHCSSRFPAI